MPFKRILYFFGLYKWTFLIGTVFVILANICGSYTNKLVENLIDTLTVSYDNNNLSLESIQPGVVQFLIFYMGLTLLSALFTYLMRQTIIVASRKVEQRLKDDLYQHIQHLDIHHFKKYPIGDFMSRMAEDVGKIRELFGPAVMYLVVMITTISISVFFMIQISKELTFYALIPLPFLSIFIYIFNIYSLKFNTRLQEKLASMTSMAQESYNGIRIIKSFTLEKKTYQTFSDMSESYKTQALRLVLLDSFFLPIVSLLMGLSIIIAIYKGGILNIDKAITIGGLTSFIMFVNRLMWPVMSIGWVASLVQKAKSALIRYEEIMSLPLEEKLTYSSPTSIQGKIQFQNVSFTYSDTGIKALDNISFEIKKGERWLIIGKTGCGKSTLAELLMQFYTDYSGNIFIDGQNLREIPTETLRNHISYIPQDVFLFSDTVQNNINFYNGEDDDQVIQTAAQDAQIHNEIIQFKDQYQTIVGERGVTLSGGQKQRISIARALIKASPIYLFDDCLSAVDVETERKLIEAMNKKDQSGTIILITHRVFNQLEFDKVLVLNDGKIMEIGTHQELLDKKGYYFDIYKKQEMKGLVELSS